MPGAFTTTYHTILLSLLILPGAICAQELFDAVKVVKNKIHIKLSAPFKKQFLKASHLVFTYTPEINLEHLDKSIITAGALMCLAPMVWVSNQDYYVDVMDQELYQSLEIIRHVFCLLYPHLAWQGQIIPRTIIKNQQPKNLSDDHVITLFSGGLDSTCSTFDHPEKKQLLVTIQARDIKLRHPKAWETIRTNCQNFATVYGHDFTYMSFNLDTLLNYEYLDDFITNQSNWWSATLGSLSHIGAVFPLAYLKGYKHILIAASDTKECPTPFGNHPLIDNNLLCAGIQAHHDGGEYTRPEKIQVILKACMTRGLALPPLRVCQKASGAANCCRCLPKCLRTMNSLIILGQDPQRWGFNTSLERVLSSTRKQLEANPSMSPHEIWHWTCNQKKAQELLAGSTKELLDAKLTEYLYWLTSIDFRQFSNTDYLKYEKKKSFYANLWDLAYHDPFGKLINIEPIIFD